MVDGVGGERVAELAMLCGLDDDLDKQTLATSNRILELLAQNRPALEWDIGPHLNHQAIPEMLAHARPQLVI